jgi:hypothetical protein
MQEWTPRSVAWWAATWLLRLAVGGGAFLAWGAFERGGYWSAATYAGMAALGFGLQRAARRQALGWITDGNGERQKVEGWVRGHAVCTPTTRAARIAEEAQFRDERRKRLVWWGVPGWALSGLAIYLVASNARYSDGIGFTLFLSVSLGGVAALAWLGVLGKEVLYLLGWQDMKGAKVLDGEPRRPGLEEVLLQKTHGDARLATEQEVQAAAGGVANRSPVHDQEF